MAEGLPENAGSHSSGIGGLEGCLVSRSVITLAPVETDRLVCSLPSLDGSLLVRKVQNLNHLQVLSVIIEREIRFLLRFERGAGNPAEIWSLSANLEGLFKDWLSATPADLCCAMRETRRLPFDARVGPTGSEGSEHPVLRDAKNVPGAREYQNSLISCLRHRNFAEG